MAASGCGGRHPYRPPPRGALGGEGRGGEGRGGEGRGGEGRGGEGRGGERRGGEKRRRGDTTVYGTGHGTHRIGPHLTDGLHVVRLYADGEVVPLTRGDDAAQRDGMGMGFGIDTEIQLQLRPHSSVECNNVIVPMWTHNSFLPFTKKSLFSTRKDVLLS